MLCSTLVLCLGFFPLPPFPRDFAVYIMTYGRRIRRVYNRGTRPDAVLDLCDSLFKHLRVHSISSYV